MSVSAKAAEFPVPCANSACGRELCGPVKHCPFCGESVQRAAPVAKASTPAPVVVPAPAPVPVPVETRGAESLDFDIASVQSAEPPKPAPVPPAPAARAPVLDATPDKPGATSKILLLGLVVLTMVAGGVFYLMTSKNNQSQMEQVLLDGQRCLRQKDFNCALDNAERVLQKNASNPAAISLLERAKSGLNDAQRDKDLAVQKEQDRKAAQEESDRRKREEVAKREQLEKEKRDREELAAQDKKAAPPAVTTAPTPAPARQPARADTVSPSVLLRSLTEARNALARKDYQSAITVAGLVLNMDPGNRQAQNIINQARQLQAQALNRTTIE